MKRYGVVHLYATGSCGPGESLVAAGVLPLGSEPAPVQEWVFDPGKPVRRRVFERSGLDTAAVKAAASWDALAPGVQRAFGSFDVLFYFGSAGESEWLERELISDLRPAPRLVDLKTLAALFLPGTENFDVRKLCETHVPGYQRSGPQLSQVLLALKALLADLVRVVLTEAEGILKSHPVYSWLVAMGTGADAFGTDVLRDLAGEARRIHWENYDGFPEPILRSIDVPTLQSHLEVLAAEPEKRTDTGSVKRTVRVQPENVDAAFAALRSAENMTERSAQRDYAQFCAHAINQGGLYAAEAGTGTGKTLGYLVPAAEFVRRNPGYKVLIATATKTLQDQIVDEELPRLRYRQSPYRDLRGAKLKGKGNFLCAGALIDTYHSVFLERGAPSTRKLAWIYLYNRLRHAGGTIDDIPADLTARLPDLRDLLADVNAETNCTPDLCRMGARCVYTRQLREALQADIVVTNHHKLASLPPALSEKIRAIIVDEADQLADNLRGAMRMDLSPSYLWRDLISRLNGLGKRRRGFLDVLRERIDRESRGTDVEMIDLLSRIIDDGNGISAVLELLDTDVLRSPTEERWQVVARQRPEFVSDVCVHLEALEEALQKTASGLRDLCESDRYQDLDERRGQGRRQEKARLERYATTAAEWTAKVNAIRSEFGSPDWVHTSQGRERYWALSRIPYDLKELVEDVLIAPYHAVILTSATLYVENKTDFLLRQLGRTRPLDGEIRLPSPFDYNSHVYGAVTTFLPAFDFKAPQADRQRWQRRIAQTLAALTIATEGRTLILFTSMQELQSVSELLEPMLEPYDIELLRQNGTSRSEVHRFRENEHSVLMGVDRFWYGIDFPGSTLSQVIVVRLPNPSLGDPLVEHRRDVEGDAFWSSFYHPQVRLRLRQGFGRLIRRETDRGLFIILDARAVRNRSMRAITDELPIALREVSAWDDDEVPLDFRRMIHQGLGVARLRTQLEDRKIDPLKAVNYDASVWAPESWFYEPSP